MYTKAHMNLILQSIYVLLQKDVEDDNFQSIKSTPHNEYSSSVYAQLEQI